MQNNESIFMKLWKNKYMNTSAYSTKYILKSAVFVSTLMISSVVYGIFMQDLIMLETTILVHILAAYFLFQKQVNIFDPFALFTMFYFFIIPTALYLYLSKFDKSLYIGTSNTSEDIFILLEISLMYYIFGYLFALLGYKIFKKNGTPNITLEDRISLKIVSPLMYLFASVALFNFIYNVIFFAGGNLLLYFSNVSVRQLEFEKFGGTTLGYQFGYVAAYLSLYKSLKMKNVNLTSFIILVVAILIKASTGRITDTLLFSLSFFAIYYVVNIKYARENNTKYIFLLLLLVMLGLLFYFYRITSSLFYNNMLDASWVTTILSFVNFESIMYYAADGGNVPNVAIFMKIIDSWGRDIGFLYGETLVTWVYSFLPKSIRPVDYQVSMMIKNTWYTHINGGSLPPTGVGEMYANFGVLGPFIGMFLFGSFIALIYNMLFKFNNYWYLVIYTCVSLHFIMIYPKGEFDNLTLWDIFPMLITYLGLRIMTAVLTINSSDVKLGVCKPL